MADKEKKWSVDWRTFNWKEVDKEIEEKQPKSEEEITTISRDMFIEYLHWLNETSPELLDIAFMMTKMQQEGAPEEDLDIFRNLGDRLTGRKG